MEKTILIIGGAGYIGPVLTSHFLAAGYKVNCLDLLLYQNDICVTQYLGNPNYRFIYGDMSDLSAMNRALEGVTDVVLLAGLVGDPITKKYPAASHAINDVGILSCINYLNGKGLDRVVFVSTCSNYGLIKDGEKADENFPLNPLSLYAEDKVNNEQYLTSHRDEFDFSPTILRFATAFGASPRMRFDLTVNEFIYDAFTKKHLEVYDPDTWRPYCHVRDFSKLIMRVLSMEIQKTNFETFNAGGNNNNLTKRHIVEIIAKYIPDLKVDYVVGGSDPRNYVVDFSKVKDKLHFEPTWSVDDGVKELIYFLENGLYLDFPEDRNFYGNYYIEDGT